MPVFASSSIARARAAFGTQRLVQLEHLADLVADGVERVQRRHRLLEDHADRRTADAAHLALDFCIRSSPPKRMRPVVVAASTRRSTDSAVIDLPDPDSPTSANFSPGATVNETSSTTGRRPKRTGQMLDLEQRAAGRRRVVRALAHDLRVSNASRSASPMKVSSSIVTTSSTKVGR
jgi:hypothetical protein